MKYFEGFDEGSSGGEAGESSETNPIWRGKTVQYISYGTCDLESGIRSDNGVGSCSRRGSSSQEEDLYDKKVCVICYDEQRNCFFVPCGHCATCYVCAQRYDIPISGFTFTHNYYTYLIQKCFIYFYFFIFNYLQDFHWRKQDVSCL